MAKPNHSRRVFLILDAPHLREFRVLLVVRVRDDRHLRDMVYAANLVVRIYDRVDMSGCPDCQ